MMQDEIINESLLRQLTSYLIVIIIIHNNNTYNTTSTFNHYTTNATLLQSFDITNANIALTYNYNAHQNNTKYNSIQPITDHIDNECSDESINDPSPTPPTPNNTDNNIINIANTNKFTNRNNNNNNNINYHPYRGRHPRFQFMTDSNFLKTFFMIFVMLSILAHFTVIFICAAFNKLNRFKFFSTLVLFQWILYLTYLIAWHQNYRFELSIELFLFDGYSLSYLLGIQPKKFKSIHEEMDVAITNNDKHLTSPNPWPQEPYQYHEYENNGKRVVVVVVAQSIFAIEFIKRIKTLNPPRPDQTAVKFVVVDVLITLGKNPSNSLPLVYVNLFECISETENRIITIAICIHSKLFDFLHPRKPLKLVPDDIHYVLKDTLCI